MHLSRVTILAVLLALGACTKHDSGGSGVHGTFRFLTTDNLDGEEDDPAVALGPDGTIHVVWFSDRDGTKDLYYVRSQAIDPAHGTITWSAPTQITHLDPAQFPPPTQGDNYPALAIDDDGMLNVAWHRWNLANESHILFLRSDGTDAGWAAASEVDVTTGPQFDRFPNLVRFGPADLRIYFGSSTAGTPGVNEVFMTSSIDDGQHWSTPVPVASLNAALEHTSLPMVAKLSDTSFVATIERWSVGAPGDVLDPTTDVFHAESADGENWSVDPVTSALADVEPDFAPALFLDRLGEPWIAWATTSFGDPTADIVRVAASDRDLYPLSAATLSPALGLADHSPRVLACSAGGQPFYVMIWVRIADGVHNQVGYRLLAHL